MSNEWEEHNRLMKAHAERKDVPFTRMSHDRQPSPSEPVYWTDKHGDLHCALKVHGHGYFAIRVDRKSDVHTVIFTDAEVRGDR